MSKYDIDMSPKGLKEMSKTLKDMHKSVSSTTDVLGEYIKERQVKDKCKKDWLILLAIATQKGKITWYNKHDYECITTYRGEEIRSKFIAADIGKYQVLLTQSGRKTSYAIKIADSNQNITEFYIVDPFIEMYNFLISLNFMKFPRVRNTGNLRNVDMNEYSKNEDEIPMIKKVIKKLKKIVKTEWIEEIGKTKAIDILRGANLTEEEILKVFASHFCGNVKPDKCKCGGIIMQNIQDLNEDCLFKNSFSCYECHFTISEQQIYDWYNELNYEDLQ